MEDLFGFIFTIMIVGAILGGVGVFNAEVEVSTFDPIETVGTVVTPTAVKATVKTTVAPIRAKASSPIVKPPLVVEKASTPSTDVMIELNELDTVREPDAPLFIDLKD